MSGGQGSEDGRIARLLAALVALTAALLVVVVAGGLLMWREYGRLRAAVGDVAGRDAAPARQLAQDLSRKQEAASRELAAAARDASRQLAEFDRRAEELRSQRGGPIVGASRTIELTQLMADELLLQLKLMNTLEAVLEKTVRPLPEQRGLLQAEGQGAAQGSPGREGRAPPRR